jgi:hypothetical protein
MGFSGGGSNITKAHTHDSTVVQDGGSLAANVTQFGLSSGSILYSDGSNIQELSVGTGAQVMGVSGSLPAWITNTSNPLIKVSKTYADIVVGTTSMDIYTLPQDAALVNIWTDITTVFDISTAVTIGDAGDDNGFTEATDWTSGTGLTDATRGAYVTSFKTMRSTSGTTDIKAYNFSTTGGTGTTFSQLTTNDNRTISLSAGRQELAQQMNTGQVVVGEDIGSVSFWIKTDTGSPAGTIRSFIRQSDGTEIQESSDTLDASTLTGSYVEYAFAFPDTTLSASNMITISGADMTGSGVATCNTDDSGEMTNGKLYDTATAGSSYNQLVGNKMKMTVEYAVGPLVGDTQGAVDFYLQVVD